MARDLGGCSNLFDKERYIIIMDAHRENSFDHGISVWSYIFGGNMKKVTRSTATLVLASLVLVVLLVVVSSGSTPLPAENVVVEAIDVSQVDDFHIGTSHVFTQLVTKHPRYDPNILFAEICLDLNSLVALQDDLGHEAEMFTQAGLDRSVFQEWYWETASRVATGLLELRTYNPKAWEDPVVCSILKERYARGNPYFPRGYNAHEIFAKFLGHLQESNATTGEPPNSLTGKLEALQGSS